MKTNHTLHEALNAIYPKSVRRENGGGWWEYENNDYDTLNWVFETLPKPSREEVEAKLAELNTAGYLANLREERDKRLAETDWWAISDRTMTAEQTAYRQALRDLPANTTDPANPVWPTKP